MNTCKKSHPAHNNQIVLPDISHEIILKEDIHNGPVFEYEKLLYEIFFQKLQSIAPPQELKTRILEQAHLEHHT